MVIFTHNAQSLAGLKNLYIKIPGTFALLLSYTQIGDVKE